MQGRHFPPSAVLSHSLRPRGITALIMAGHKPQLLATANSVCVCVCVHACVRVCACVRACVCECVFNQVRRLCVCVCVCVCVFYQVGSFTSDINYLLGKEVRFCISLFQWSVFFCLFVCFEAQISLQRKAALNFMQFNVRFGVLACCQTVRSLSWRTARGPWAVCSPIVNSPLHVKSKHGV